jgi:hypothetical protein
MARLYGVGKNLILPYTPFGGGKPVSGIYTPPVPATLSKPKQPGRMAAATSGTAASRAAQEKVRLRRIENAKRYAPSPVKTRWVAPTSTVSPGTRARLIGEISEPAYPVTKNPYDTDTKPTKRRVMTVPFPVRDPTITSEAMPEVYPKKDPFEEYAGSDNAQDNRDYDNNTKPSGKPGTPSAARSPRGTTYRKPTPSPTQTPGPTIVGDAGKMPPGKIAWRSTFGALQPFGGIFPNRPSTIARIGLASTKILGATTKVPFITNPADLLAESLVAGRKARAAQARAAQARAAQARAAQARSTSSRFLRSKSVSPFPGTLNRPNLPN